MQQLAALYARVSSERQKEAHTIASQTAALLEHAQKQGYKVPPQWQFQDEGYSGATLTRPGLEAIRDLAAQGQITAVLVYSPDRLSRKYAYQVLLAEEFARCGVQLIFLQAPSIQTPEDQLLVQFSRHDCRIRTGPDYGTLSSRQTPSCSTRIHQRLFPRSVRLSLREEERNFSCVFPGDRSRGPGGALDF